jgi:hypothetical protein
MIDIFALKQSDIGRWVRYDGNYRNDGKIHPETGRIKSHNGHNIFVVYHCDNDWENYADYTAESTHPSRLEFIEKPEGL